MTKEKQWGISLRDWMAGMALQGILSNSQGVFDGSEIQDSYDIADKMMKEREQ